MSTSREIKRFVSDSLQELSKDVVDALIDVSGNGAVVVTSSSINKATIPKQKEEIIRFLPKIGNSILVYERQPLWKQIGVDLDVESDSVGGIGHIPLHIDLVNASNPPDFIVFLNERRDIAGGGQSVISPFRRSLQSLDESSLDQLSSVFLRGGLFYSLANVGVEVNPFPLIQIQDNVVEWVRFTAKSRKEISSGNPDIFERFHNTMIDNEIELDLAPGDALIINQRLAAHGRRSLGLNQENISPVNRRSIYQLFVRGHSHLSSRCFTYPASTRV